MLRLHYYNVMKGSSGSGITYRKGGTMRSPTA